MKIVICWSNISGYSAACWHALMDRVRGTDVHVQIIAWESNTPGGTIAFDPALTAGLPIRLFSRAEYSNAEVIRSYIAPMKPDILTLPGWMHGPYVQLARAPELRGARKIMGVDTPWNGTWRQRLARLRIGWYVDQLSAVVVPGERAFQFMRQLKIPEHKIYRGMYGIDFSALQRAADGRAAAEQWPRKFLFLGRYHETKNIGVLLAAYRQYRESVADPWPLTCCGLGAYRDQIRACPGVADLGFVDPRQTPDVMQQHGVFVLASAYDPWPLVIVESCAAGLPVIHSEACGSAVELVRPYYNGVGVATGDVAALARAMRWFHDHPELARTMGLRGPALASAYTATLWAERWMTMFDDVMRRPAGG